MYYVITGQLTEDERTVTALIDGEVYTTNNGNPRYDEILELLQSGSDDADALRRLFDVEAHAKERLAATLSERVRIEDGVVYVDGDVVESALTDQIGKFIEQGVDDWKPLVAFLENCMANPSAHSRTQLFEWLARHNFSFAADGTFYAYKAVDGSLRSHRAGYGVVNGEVVENGKLDNSVGNTVEYPRSKVEADAAVGCASGLHAGTYRYAKEFGGASSTMLLVKVNPRDVVSVPTDCDAQKIRCCRYQVVSIVNEEYDDLVLDVEEPAWTDADW